jgi:hypothetical protein
MNGLAQTRSVKGVEYAGKKEEPVPRAKEFAVFCKDELHI